MFCIANLVYILTFLSCFFYLCVYLVYASCVSPLNPCVCFSFKSFSRGFIGVVAANYAACLRVCVCVCVCVAAKNTKNNTLKNFGAYPSPKVVKFWKQRGYCGGLHYTVWVFLDLCVWCMYVEPCLQRLIITSNIIGKHWGNVNSFVSHGHGKKCQETSSDVILVVKICPRVFLLSKELMSIQLTHGCIL